MARAKAYLDLDRPDQAEQVLKEVAAEGSNNPTWLGMLASVQVALGQPEVADQIVDQALALEPESSWLLHVKGLALLQRGKADDAVETLTAALSLSPHDGELYLALARATLAAGDWKSGSHLVVELTHEAERLQVSPGDAAEVRAAALAAAGRKDEARLEVQRALAETPTHGGLRALHTRLVGGGYVDVGEAAELLRGTLAANPLDQQAKRELLRRFQSFMVRWRIIVCAAQVLAAFTLLVPWPARIATSAVGLAATLGILWLEDRSAATLVGREGHREYLKGHPGLRVGRALVVLAGVLAWAPTVAGPGTPLGAAALVWLAFLSVPVATLLAWGGGWLVDRSVSDDEYDPSLPLSRRHQRSAWRLRHLGPLMTIESRVYLYSMLPIGLLSVLLPRGVGIAAVALGLGALLSWWIRILVEMSAIKMARDGLLGEDVGELPRQGLIYFGQAVRLGFISLLATLAITFGQINVVGASIDTGKRTDPSGHNVPEDERGVPGLRPLPSRSFSPPTFVPPSLPSLDIPTLEVSPTP